MINANDLPRTIALFPLSGALLLPRARLPLQIFEPRYLAMLDDVLKTDHRMIGMIQPSETPAGASRLQSIGCAGRVTSFSETDDGRYLITLTGISRFRLREEVAGFTPYRRAEVSWSAFASDLTTAEQDPGLDRDAFFALLARYFQAMELATDWGSLKEAGPEMLINALSMLCPFASEDKQALLEAPHLSERRDTLVTLMEFALLGGRGEEIMQ